LEQLGRHHGDVGSDEDALEHVLGALGPGGDGALGESVPQFLATMGCFAQLGGHFQQKDPENGTSVEVSLVARYALTWWVDARVREVKLVQIGPAD
jgi:hypothetical protein